MRRVVIAAAALSVGGGSLVACAGPRGDLRANIGMMSHLPGPQPLPEPSRPPGFPPVQLVWEQALGAAPRVEEAPEDELPAETAAVLPDLPDDASRTEEQFHAMAVRAVRYVVDLDRDDPAELLNLNEQLDSNEALAELVPLWQPVIEKTIERAFLLQHFAGPLRRVRTSFAEARFDGSTGLYANVKKRLCERAFKKLEVGGESAMALEVTVPPVGRRPLVYFQALCENAPESTPESSASMASPPPAPPPAEEKPEEPPPAEEKPAESTPAQAMTSEESAPPAGPEESAPPEQSAAPEPSESAPPPAAAIEFPAAPGPQKLRRATRKVYQKTFQGRQVRKVGIVEPWKKQDGERVMRAIVGAQIGRGSDATCVVEEIAIHQRPGRRARPRCEVLRSSTVSCDTLR